MAAPTLAQTERLLWQLITAPEGAAAGLARLDPDERARVKSLVRGDARLAALERVDIYADMYFYRIRDALKEDFGALCAVIGEANFHNLVTDYLIAHPPTHFSLRYAGQHLPAFVRMHALTQRWPYLPDLAALEWAILESFDAADAPVLDAEALARLPQDRWPALRFQLTPSLQLLRLEWPVHLIWRQTQAGEAVEAPTATPTVLRVWRQDLRVFHRSIEGPEAAALGAFANGATFAAVCEQLVEADAATSVEHALAALREWLQDGLLAGYAVS